MPTMPVEQQELQSPASCAQCVSPADMTKSFSGVWTLADILVDSTDSPIPQLLLSSFNHVAREVICVENSKKFYCEVMGFTLIPRPPFDCDGYWLWGYGLSLHLVSTTNLVARKAIKLERIKHFSTCLPRVDHIAFITHNLSAIRAILDEKKVYYKADTCDEAGIEQIFFFDPDGNVIEVSNCAPVVGEIKCNQSVIASLARSPLPERSHSWSSVPPRKGEIGEEDINVVREKSTDDSEDVASSSSSSSSSSPSSASLATTTTTTAAAATTSTSLARSADCDSPATDGGCSPLISSANEELDALRLEVLQLREQVKLLTMQNLHQNNDKTVLAVFEREGMRSRASSNGIHTSGCTSIEAQDQSGSSSLSSSHGGNEEPLFYVSEIQHHFWNEGDDEDEAIAEEMKIGGIEI